MYPGEGVRMHMAEITDRDTLSYACPKCKQTLRSAYGSLHCCACSRIYPIAGSIPDFLSGDSQASLAPLLDMAKKADLIAPTYEAPLWYSMILNLSGTAHTSMRSIAEFHSDILSGVTGYILDVACGPATYGRRVASPSRAIYGIDISMGMLRQGMIYIMREGIFGVRLARARVEELPFEDGVFDGVICSGSLYLFPNTALALREIARTMKPGAPLAVQTVVANNAQIARLSDGRQDIHAFEILELQRFLMGVGFEGFQPQLDGPSLTFSVHKMVRTNMASVISTIK